MNTIETSPSRVAVVACSSYDQSQVDHAVERGVQLLGGIHRFCSKGEKILLKPNILASEYPEKAVTTHPSVFTAAAKLFLQAGSKPEWGDSPGADGILGTMATIAKKTGIPRAAEELDIPPADFKKAVSILFPEALLVKKLELARGAVETDALISLSKMKTHGVTRITGAVKNLFGCVPGIRKGEYHVKMPRIDHFSALLVDICRYLKPRLNIMDGIVAMEGNGPRGGTPKKMGVLLFSEDPIAIDAVFCRLIDLNTEYVPTMEPGYRTGLGLFHYSDIELLGEPIGELIRSEFQVIRRSAAGTSLRFPGFLKSYITPRPVIQYPLCTNCGTCVKVCPKTPKAVDWRNSNKNQKPSFSYSECIRCYCCQELCPEKAIAIKTPFLGRFIHR